MLRVQAEDRFQRKRYPNYRNVLSMERRNGSSVAIKISAVSNSGSYALGLIMISVVFLGGLRILLPGLFRVRTLPEAFAVLAVLAFLILWSGIVIRVPLKALCTVELFAGDGIFRWRYRFHRWSKDLEAPLTDVTAVTSKIRWYGNRLSITMNGRTYSLGELMDDDLLVITRQLRSVLPAVTRAER